MQENWFASLVICVIIQVTNLPKPLQQIIRKITITMTMMAIVLSFWKTMQKEVEPETSICSKCWVQKGSKVNFQLERVKCSDPGEWVSNSTKVPFISFLSSAKHCKFATNVSLVLFQLWLIHFLMISPSGNIFWKENNVGSLQPAKTSWWIANAKMIICELKKNAKLHTICIKALVSSIGCYFDCEAVDCSHSAEFSGWTYWLPPTDCPQWIGRDCHKTLKHVQGCSRNIRF